MISCLNPDCHNPPVPENTEHCPNCGVPLIILRKHYRPIKPLGGGGFGKTYLAEDIDNFNEKCVIKQLAPQTQNTYALKKAKELFEQEAKQLKDLKHPQIPQLQAYFDEDDCLYLIQDFIDGENLLKELANQGTFNEQKIRDLLLDILPVLQIVHSKKIIHRDIKPENIMRRRSDGKLFLIDFGASKQLQGTMRPGTKIGTFGYAALEQMEDREVYPSSDLFSLAATCFHLMTDVYPGNLWNRQGYNWVKDWRKHLQQNVSGELGEIIDKLLELEYQDRYQSVEEVLQVLQPPPAPPQQNAQPIVQPAPTVTPPTPPQQNVQPIVQTSPPTVVQPQKPNQISQPQPKTNSSRRRFLQIGGLVVGGFIVAVVGQNILRNPNQQSTSEILSNQQSKLETPSDKLVINSSNSINTLTGHSNSVVSLAISPNTQTLVSGSADTTIKIWNLATGELKSTLSGHSNVVNSLAISPNGQTLVSGSADKTIKIWNLATGKLKSTLTGHSDSVVSLAISPDGQTLVSGSLDKTIKIWNLATGKLKSTLTGHSDTIYSLAISLNGQTLVSGSWDKTIKIWNLATGKLKSTLTSHTDLVIAISPDGQTLVSGGIDATIKIWNLATGELKSTLTGHSSFVDSLAISPDGQTLVSGSADSTIKIWNLATGELKSTLTGHSSGVDSLAISPDGQTLVSGSNDKTIKIWRLK